MQPKLYRVAVKRPLAMNEVVAIADATAGETAADAAVRGVELQRIDSARSGTVVFVTGSEESVRSFADGLMRSVKGPAAEIAAADAAALLAAEIQAD